MHKKILFAPTNLTQEDAPLMNRLPTGIIAILLISVVLTRGLSETLGPFGAGAAIYSVSSILVWLVTGKPTLCWQHLAYLYGCGLLFVGVYGRVNIGYRHG